MSKHCTLTISPIPKYPSVSASTYPSLGVAAPDRLAGVNRPSVRSVASLSFCSRASTRRLRKSERCTSPTVWDFNRSSAVDACAVKRGFEGGFGVESRDGRLDGGVELAMTEFMCIKWTY